MSGIPGQRIALPGFPAESDLYPVVGGDFVLFAEWQEKVSDEEWREAADLLKKAVESRISGARISALGGAEKLTRASRPLPLQVFEEGGTPREWIGMENEIRFRLELSGVLNPGWFLDQSKNREVLAVEVEKRRLKDTKTNRSGRLLNLFSYTGSFSLVAACGGAEETVSVDVSSRYLAWEKANHALNPRSHGARTRLLQEDARKFVDRALRKKEKYDWIVLDPPTFSKADGRPFEVSKDYLPLFEGCLDLLAPGGALLASLNDSRTKPWEFEEALETRVNARGWELSSGEADPTFGMDHRLRSAWIRS